MDTVVLNAHIGLEPFKKFLHRIIVQCPKTSEHSSRIHTTCQFQETAGLLKEKMFHPTNLFLGMTDRTLCNVLTSIVYKMQYTISCLIRKKKLLHPEKIHGTDMIHICYLYVHLCVTFCWYLLLHIPAVRTRTRLYLQI